MFNLFRSAPSSRRYITPGGKIWAVYNDMAQQHNMLIAGEVGSGKSCAINGIIHCLLHQSPNAVQLILIDPKMTEFKKYSRLPHCIAYAQEDDEILLALAKAQAIIYSRKRELKNSPAREYTGSAVYIIIDEMAEIMLTLKKSARPQLQRIMQIGRALNVHVIAGTQCPLATVIPTEIRVNFTGILGLRTATRQHSRNIIERAGCEEFPDPKMAGKALGYYLRGGSLTLYTMPLVTETEIDELCAYWQSKHCYVA